MSKLIALESTNHQLLDKTARYLALKLQAEGKQVEVLEFPQKKQVSAHFVQAHQSGEYGEVNPYAASMFYILDRYDATALINDYIDRDIVVICKGYRGTTLATLGAQISDAPTRKGFYIWADSLESGTFAIPRADVAIVLSEELPTLYELCELFPNDYIFAVDPTKVRTLLNKIIPPAIVQVKKAKNGTSSWLEALQQLGKGKQLEISATQAYANSPKSKNHKKLFAEGLHKLEHLREMAVQKAAEEHKRYVYNILSPIGNKVEVSEEFSTKSKYKNRIFEAQLKELKNDTYGADSDSSYIVSAAPRNELDALEGLLLPKTEQSVYGLSTSLGSLPILKKRQILQSYIAGSDKEPELYPLPGVSATIALKATYTDLQEFANVTDTAHFYLQPPTPRWGYNVPDALDYIIDEIEDCFTASLKLHSELEQIGELKAAESTILQGNYAQTVVYLQGLEMRKIAFSDYKLWALGADLQQLLSEQFPIISSKI